MFGHKQGWFLKRPNYEVEVLQKLFNQIYDDAHTFLQTKLNVKMTLLEAHYIRQCIDLLEGLLDTSSTRTINDLLLYLSRFRKLLHKNERISNFCHSNCIHSNFPCYTLFLHLL